MPSKNPDTYFDHPQRNTLDKIRVESNELRKMPIVQQILEGFPEFAVILDENRQIVALNSKISNIITVESLSQLVGLRLGEVFNCIHRNDVPAGCGTTKFCALCGTAKSVRATRTNRSPNIAESRIIGASDDGEIAYNLLVQTTPLELNNKGYTLFAIRDISSEKRKEVLERIFFHDVLNTGGAAQGIVALLQDTTDENERTELITALSSITTQLLNEILSQRDLSYAEAGDLELDLREIKVNDLLNLAYGLYSNHELSEAKKLSVGLIQDDIKIETDPPLLLRALGNLLKNALEASATNDEVKIYASINGDIINFHVYNNKVIPTEIQMQMFQMSFSTKNEKGRGIGTYSIKLIVEKYLKGKVDFISDEENKTIFTITLPNKFEVSLNKK